MSDGNVVMVWEGKNGTYWCEISYWVGNGYQRCERQISASEFNRQRALGK